MNSKKSILALVVLLVLVFMQGQVGAGVYFETGNDLVVRMREWEKTETKDSNPDYGSAMHYLGYIKGVNDTLSESLPRATGPVTVRQVCSIVAKYLKDHPERWSESAYILVQDALKEAFSPNRRHGE